MPYLDKAGLAYLWQKIKTALSRHNSNLLPNWYFPDPINQRGQTEYAGDTYSIDRYQISAGMGLTLADDGVLLTCGSNTWGNFFTRLEPAAIQTGYRYTLSALVKTSRPGMRMTAQYAPGYNLFGVELPASGSWELAAVTGVFSQNEQPLISINNGGTSLDGEVTVKAVKLELGSVQTLARQDADGNWVLIDPPPDKALELSKCQRYQVVFPVDAIIGNAHGYEAGHAYFSIFTPIEMRGIPTLAKERIVLMKAPYFSQGIYPESFSHVSRSPGIISGFIHVPGIAAGEKYFIAARPANSAAPLIIDANLGGGFTCKDLTITTSP